MSLSLKETILGARDRTVRPVSVPEWPGTEGKLFLRTLSGAEREEYESWAKVNAKGSGLTVLGKFLSLVLVDPAGQPVFSEEDIPLLRQKNSSVILRLTDEAQQLNRLAAEDVEDLRKNSRPSRGGSSSSGSPSPSAGA
jgi:hypothetical protein